MIHKAGIVVCIVFTVLGQVSAKVASRTMGPFPAEWADRLAYLARLPLNPYFVGSFVAGVIAALGWMVALPGVQLSRAYPFMSLNFVLVLLLSALMFGEPMTLRKAAGVALIVTGVIVGSSS